MKPGASAQAANNSKLPQIPLFRGGKGPGPGGPKALPGGGLGRGRGGGGLKPPGLSGPLGGGGGLGLKPLNQLN